jgi:hypothetical protein
MATGPDTSISFLTLADAVEYLGDTGSSDHWGRISDLMNVVASRMDAEAGRQLKASTWTEIYDGDGGAALFLQHYPLTSTDITVTVDVNRSYSTATTTYRIPSSDVLLDTEMGRVRLDGYTFDAGKESVKISYTGGYSSSGPAWDLIGAAREYLQLAWNRATKRDNIGLRTESFEGGSRTYENDLPWSVKQVLLMYKDRKVS